MIDLLIKNASIFADGELFDGFIGVQDGKIACLGSGELPEAKEVIDANGKTILPGGVEAHMHVRWPSHPERGDFYTETCAAAAGGVTTIIEHPISMPPQYSKEILEKRVERAKEDSIVDFAFFGAAGGEKYEYITDVAQGGIVGYKTFLHAAPEGREDEFVGLTTKDNYEMMKVFTEVKKTGLPITAHAEDNDIISGMIKECRAAGNVSGIDHAKSRPPISETLAVERLIRFARDFEVPLYLVHISVPEAVRMAKRAREDGQEVYIESCPQYLFLTEERLKEIGPYAKCNPPLRSPELVEEMWDYVMDGTIDTISSDHGPFTVEEKEKGNKDIFVAPAGSIGVETRFGLMNMARKEGKISLKRLVDLISLNPAKIFGLYPQKGSIHVGADADLVIVDLDQEFSYEHTMSLSKSKEIGTTFEGMTMCGVIDTTLVRGKKVYNEGQISAKRGYGEWLQHSSL